MKTENCGEIDRKRQKKRGEIGKEGQREEWENRKNGVTDRVEKREERGRNGSRLGKEEKNGN